MIICKGPGIGGNVPCSSTLKNQCGRNTKNKEQSRTTTTTKKMTKPKNNKNTNFVEFEYGKKGLLNFLSYTEATSLYPT